MKRPLPAFTLPPAAIRLWQDSQVRWLRLAPRERRLLTVGGVLACIALVFLVLVEPAWNRYQRLSEHLPGLRTQAATVESITREARALQRTRGGSMTPEQARQALVDSLGQAGIEGSVEPAPADVSTEADSLQVTVEQASAGSLMQWLAAAPAQTRLTLREAALERPADDNGKLLIGKLSGQLLFVPGAPAQAR